MSKNKKSKKSKNQKGVLFFARIFECIKAKKVAIAASAAGILVATLAAVFVSNHIKTTAEKTVNVGFYQMPEKVSEAVKGVLEGYNADDESRPKFNFTELSEREAKSEKIAGAYDIIFTPDGFDANLLREKGMNISEKAFGYLPSSLRKNNQKDSKKSVPIVLDHFEISYNNNILQNLNLSVPQTFQELENFLEKSKRYAFTPFFTNGGDDEILLGLITAFVEAKGGYKAYEDFKDAVQKNPSLDSFLELELGNGNAVITMAQILDMLRSWQENGIVHPAWFNATYRDILAFVESNQVSTLFTTLSVHRTIPYKLIRDFTTDRVPFENARIDHALIAPGVCGIKMSKKSINDSVLTFLLLENSQTKLSNRTQLAPVALRGESFDVQADDVRFFAASCRYGAVPSFYAECFTNGSQKPHELCEQIRNYLRTGRI